MMTYRSGYEAWDLEDDLEDEEFEFGDEDLDVEDLNFEEEFTLDEAELLDEGLSYEDWDEELITAELMAYDDLVPEEPDFVVGFFEEEDQGDQALQVLDDLGVSLDDDVTVLRRSEVTEDDNDAEAWQVAVWDALRRLLTATAAEEADASRDEWRLESMQMVVVAKVAELDPDEIQAMFRYCGAAEVEFYTSLDTSGSTAEM